jgi:hypothetical protein
MDEEGNGKLKLHRSATSAPTVNIRKLNTVTLFFPTSLLTKECGCTDSFRIQKKKSAIHSIETFKIACERKVRKKKRRREK